MMTFRALILLIAISLPIKAQQDYTHHIVQVGKIDFVSHHPDFNPFAKAHDRLWFNGAGVTAPRVLIHIGFALANTGIDWTLRKVHTPEIIRKIVVRGGLPLTPHLIQMYSGLKGNIYELNTYDWFYDFQARQSVIGLTKDEKIFRILTDIPLSGWARP